MFLVVLSIEFIPHAKEKPEYVSACSCCLGSLILVTSGPYPQLKFSITIIGLGWLRFQKANN